MRFAQLLIAVSVLVLALYSPASALHKIDFESLSHGEIVTNQFAGDGVTFSAINVSSGPDLAIIFDSTETGTADPDLEDPWSAVGNIPSSEILGNLLIIAENGVDNNGDGFIDSPDDEGSRPAGSILIDFAMSIQAFGFDLIDVEGPTEYGRDRGYFATFYSSGGGESSRVGFGDLINPLSAFYDPTIAYGNNSANRVSPFTAEALGLSDFTRVEINFGGSAAIDNIVYVVTPEPSTMILFGLGLLGVLGATRIRRTN